MKRFSLSLFVLQIAFFVSAQTHVTFTDTKNWTTQELQKYVGQTIVFDQPVYTCNNYNGLTASMHRVMSPTNQALPLSAEYNAILSVNSSATFTIKGLSGYHRMGETIYGLVATINTRNSITVQSYDRIEGTRADMEAGIPDLSMTDENGSQVQPNLLVCAANLEYYLVENLGTGYGPDNQSEHNKQKTKVLAGLSKINADIYGLVEIEQGQSALSEIAQELTRLTGRHFTYINDGGSAYSSYTKSGYVYCSDVVRPYGKMVNNNTRVQNRKKLQAFDVIATGERFIFSINHFKAKSGTATGLNADQGDGQGTFNADRIDEARSVINSYNSNKGTAGYDDEDILFMGDLNAYAKEDPIRVFTDAGMTDLHRYFHADSSYSYTFHGQAGYLDHALCNSSLLPQITGMAAYHVNSDESDNYTYDKSSDQTMFRYSDHDPILVGLSLGASFSTRELVPTLSDVSVHMTDGRLTVKHAEGGQLLLACPDGRFLLSLTINEDEFVLPEQLPAGLYILNIYAHGGILRQKYLVK